MGGMAERENLFWHDASGGRQCMDVVSLLQNYAIELNEGKKSVKSDWMMTSIGNSYSPNDL